MQFLDNIALVITFGLFYHNNNSYLTTLAPPAACSAAKGLIPFRQCAKDICLGKRKSVQEVVNEITESLCFVKKPNTDLDDQAKYEE